MFCTKCGAQLKDDVAYCPNCGNRFHDVQQETDIVLNKQGFLKK